jgi:hypothetical protein
LLTRMGPIPGRRVVLVIFECIEWLASDVSQLLARHKLGVCTAEVLPVRFQVLCAADNQANQDGHLCKPIQIYFFCMNAYLLEVVTCPIVTLFYVVL